MVDTGKKRGALLTIWLILMLVANIGTAISFLYLLTGGLIFLPTTIPYSAIVITAILSVLNVIFVILLLMWKKWAFFALCGSAVIIFIINLIIGSGVSSILGLLGPAILYLIMRPKWDLFE